MPLLWSFLSSYYFFYKHVAPARTVQAGGMSPENVNPFEQIFAIAFNVEFLADEIWASLNRTDIKSLTGLALGWMLGYQHGVPIGTYSFAN